MEGYIGTILPWAGTFAPRNWAFCAGQIMQIAQNQALYSIIGTYYGGDGRTTFVLPDLRGRAPVGAGQGPGLTDYPLGTKYGTEQTTLNANQMPAHIHNNTLSTAASAITVNVAIPSVSSSPANAITPTNSAILGKTTQATPIYSSATADTTLEPFNATGTVTPQVSITNAPAGAGLPVDNRQPLLALNFIICINGMYPARN